MSEKVILNENVAWDDDIHDSIGPDYGFPRSRPITRVSAKAPGGQPVSREVTNSGHSFQLSWLNRSFACVQRIKYFVEQFEDGYFTIIDHDGGGRHYVGRFTGTVAEVQRGNDSYDIQDLLFEEVPGVPMLKYPSNWERDSISLRAFNDYGKQLLATSGAWVTNAGPVFTTLDSSGAAGDFATMEYRGYGYELWMQKGPAYGIVSIFLDGVQINTIDLYAPAAMGAQPVALNSQVSLDLHRLKVYVQGVRNVASTGNGASWCMMRVMR